jgi:hypothetical protein
MYCKSIDQLQNLINVVDKISNFKLVGSMREIKDGFGGEREREMGLWVLREREREREERDLGVGAAMGVGEEEKREQ